MIGILDFGPAGNVMSVKNALAREGVECKIVTKLEGRGKKLSGIIIPGVGAFSQVGKFREKFGMELKSCGVPVLGICLGMQAFFEGSEECKGARGLAIMRGKVRKIGGKGMRLPQLGWNRVYYSGTAELFSGIPDGSYFYFANSYAANAGENAETAFFEYGNRFSAALRRGNFFGVQFHPEKSGKEGAKLLCNFAKICVEYGMDGKIIPAIDILGGKVAVLRQGKEESAKFFGSPLEAAEKMVGAGFRRVHMVDLDAAFGREQQGKILRKICEKFPELSVQWGGGLRSKEAVEIAFQSGAKKAVFGSALLSNPNLVEWAVQKFGEENVLGAIDLSGNKARVNGWVKKSEASLDDAIAAAKSCKAGGIILTSVDRDGTGRGPDIELVKAAREKWNGELIASGGIRNAKDVGEALGAGADAAIAGRAFYESKFEVC